MILSHNRVYKDIIDQIETNHAILFLGAGSAQAASRPDGKTGLVSKELAREIMMDLNNGKDPDFEATLMEASEYYISAKASGRTGLERFIRDRLAGLQPTIGHYLATALPWRAIVTTNYNQVAEHVWEEAVQGGYAAREIVAIRQDEDIIKRAGIVDKIRLYKPHGCISLATLPDTRMILTPEDYFKSRDLRPKMFDEISALARDSSTVFIGYSLDDYTFRNVYYQIYSELGSSAHKSFSISPEENPTRYEWRAIAMSSELNAINIDEFFDTFMLKLTRARGFLCGPLKSLLAERWPTLEKNYPRKLADLTLDDFLNLPEKQ